MSDTIYLSNGTEVNNHTSGTPEADALFDRLRGVVKDVVKDIYQAIADEYQHEVIGTPVIRTCLLTQDAKDKIGRDVMTCHRLFDLSSSKSILYTTEFFLDDKPACFGPQTFVVAKTESFEEFGRPCSPEMLGFDEYFFVAPVSELNGLYGQQLESIAPATLFSALVRDGQIVAVRRYCNKKDALLANWQSIYVLFARRSGRIDKARDLLNLAYIDAYSHAD
jgi:hypothetical protein